MFYLMVRSFGKNHPTEWFKATIEELQPTGVILATKPGADSHEELLGFVPDVMEKILIEEPNWGFGVLQRMFAAETGQNLPRLSLSPGAVFGLDHLAKGLSAVEGGYGAASWHVPAQGNDGTLPGKLGYNYAMMYSAEACQSLAKMPKEWIDFAENGVVGHLNLRSLNGEITEGPLGGGEETLYAIWLNKLGMRFAHFVTQVIGHTVATGTGVSFDWKIVRKTFTALAYLQAVGVDASDYMKMWDVK
jgi:hypothetical protein